MAELSSEQKDKLMADLRAVIADAEELLRQGAASASETTAELRERIQARVLKAKDSLARLQESAIERARAAGHQADDFVHENPWKSIGVAAGIGLVVGLLIGRR